ncbi:MAG: hypothetical protein DRR08_31850 [Candidatus Parabeggiatoa sp. nov. 2]|nr:MAG: hypothetical protein B6247_06955 [Beggiatoa sp. 4572_84]RKZ48172.1 MAG: hypothetical protein DRR08_31850 [Gammaproteobacteria bacterium]HEC84252.1 tetratricopeptide repeat protein [Thioploca sp.]
MKLKNGLVWMVAIVAIGLVIYQVVTAAEIKPLELANTYNSQVAQYYQQGQFQKARPLAEKAFKIRKEILG